MIPKGEGAESSIAAFRVKSVSKTFGGEEALRQVSMAAAPGSITALLGQNGSGKSTLVKILAGFHAPDPGGQLYVNENAAPLPLDPVRSHKLGFRFVHQDLALVDEMTISENFALARGPVRGRVFKRIQRTRENEEIAGVLRRYSITVSPQSFIHHLSPAEQTMVAIARAAHEGPNGEARPRRILILDEPTRALPEQEVEKVLEMVRRTAEAGNAVLYVTHRLDEVFRIAEQVIILRDGQVVVQRPLEHLDADEVVRLILGREVAALTRHVPTHGARVVLEMRGIRTGTLQNVSLEVRSGEVLGVTGLLGCGRSELARVAAGVQQPDDGSIFVDGESVNLRDPRTAIKHGIAYVPQDRLGMGVISEMSLLENLTLPTLPRFVRRGRIDSTDERSAAGSIIKSVQIVPPDYRREITSFSGGNQQKAVIGKGLLLRPKVLLLDEPTQGVDVGAQAEIANIIRRLAGEGVAVFLASSDYAELERLCHRVMVLNRGRVVAVLEKDEISEGALTAICSHQGSRDSRREE